MTNIELYQNYDNRLLFDDLRKIIDFAQYSVIVYGKTYLQPRLTKWYGKVAYKYSGLELPACEMPNLLKELGDELNKKFDLGLNSVLCNLYRDGRDCVGWHCDDEVIFGPDPVVASLSYGATRTFSIKSKKNKNDILEYDLVNGSLVIMREGVQAQYLHSIQRTKKEVGERINLTFRKTM